MSNNSDGQDKQSTSAVFVTAVKSSTDRVDVETFLSSRNDLSSRELVDVLLLDQQFQSTIGHLRTAEWYLARWSAVQSDPELLIDLLYGELRASEAMGRPIGVDAIAQRFPEHAQALRRQIEVHRWCSESKTGGGDETLLSDNQEPLDDKTAGFPLTHVPRYEGERSDDDSTSDVHAMESKQEASSDRVGQGMPGFGGDSETTTDPVAPLSPSDFDLIECLGRGGMGEVYRARQRSLGKTVAIKTMRRSLLENPEAVKRFIREGRAVASLSHPNIVDVHGLGRLADGGYFMVMDIVEGVGLDRLLKKDGPLPPRRAAELMAVVADAVAHANSRGIIHRDLKPANIILDAKQQPRVTDFGLARMTFGAGLSTPGQVIGTVQFMAPEQVDAKRWGEIGPHTDIYGLGATIFNLLTGLGLWESDDKIGVLMSIVDPDRPVAWPDERDVESEPSEIRIGPPIGDTSEGIETEDTVEANSTPPMQDIPPSLRAIVMRCLAKESADRYESASDLADALRRWLADSADGVEEDNVQAPTIRSTVSGSASRTAKSPNLTVRLLVLIGALLLIAVVLMLIFGRDTGSNVPPLLSEFQLSLFEDGDIQRQVELLDAPRPVVSGDRLRIEADMTRPSHAYLYWLDSSGDVSQVWPADSDSEKIIKLSLPAVATDGYELYGTAGTEICILLLSEKPIAPEDQTKIRDALKPSKPLAMLEPDKIVVDGRFLQNKKSPTDEERDRALGAAKPLKGADLIHTVDTLLNNLPVQDAEFHYIALPHAAMR